MQVNMYGAADAARKRLAEQTAQQGDQGDANQGNTTASHELFYPQLGVKLCSMAGGGAEVGNLTQEHRQFRYLDIGTETLFALD